MPTLSANQSITVNLPAGQILRFDTIGQGIVTLQNREQVEVGKDQIDIGPFNFAQTVSISAQSLISWNEYGFKQSSEGFTPFLAGKADADNAFTVPQIAAMKPVRQLRRLAFIGDSLTSNSTLPTAPRGFGFWGTTGVSNLNSLGGWIANNGIDGRAPSGSGTLETDGAGRLRWAFSGDAFGSWVDVSKSGFYEIQSGQPNRSIHVAITKVFQRNTPATDTITTTGIVQSNVGQPIFFPSWVQGAIGQRVNTFHYGIPGDTVGGVEDRWESHVAASNPDAVVLLIGTNDQTATVANIQPLADRYISLVERMLQRVPVVYIGGIFPRTDVALGVRQNLARFTNLIREYAATRPYQVKFWDAWPRMVSPTATDGSFRTGIAHTDNLHLMPFGAWVAADEVVTLLRRDWNLPAPSWRSRGFVPWDSSVRYGAMNANPTLKGTAGTVIASRGITGTAPDSWTIDRGNGAGGTQTLTTSFTSSVSNPDSFTMTVANSGAADHHELSQTVTLPAGVRVGDWVVFELDLQIQQATLLSTLQAQINSNGNICSAYALQPGRPLSIFASGVAQPIMRLRSEPIQITSAITTFSMRLRVGGGAGSSGVILIERFELMRAE